MTETKSHEYFYCSQCHKRDHIAKGIDLEKVYTERFGILSDNKREGESQLQMTSYNKIKMKSKEIPRCKCGRYHLCTCGDCE